MNGTGASARLALGVRVGAWAGTLLLGLIYIGAAPTDYYRARIPFLLATGSGSALAFLFLVFTAFGALAMLCARRDFSWPATRGILLVSAVGSAAVFSGLAARFSPQFPEGPIRWAFVILLVVIVTVGLARERARRPGVAPRLGPER